MSPPGGINGGSGMGIPPSPGTRLPTASQKSSLPGGKPGSGTSSVPPSPIPVSSLPANLKDKNILIVFNPGARDGAIAKELPLFEKKLQQAGAYVESLETHPEMEPRREEIRKAVNTMLHWPGKVYVLPLGGDGTVGEAEYGSMKAAGIKLDFPNSNPVGSIRFQERIVLVLADKGKYSDRAVIVGAPGDAAKMVEFIRRGIEFPYRPPIIELEKVIKGDTSFSYEVAGHSFGLGIGGALFALREQNKKGNPEVGLREGLTKFFRGKLNRGRLSYLRLVFPSLASPYARWGVDVQITHVDSRGSSAPPRVLRGAEIMVAPNRIIAGYGGIPGAWNETKLVILPPGPRMMLGLSEIVGRGILTKYFGFNLVGPGRIRTLPMERQILISPGERLEVEVRVPDSPGWAAERLFREKLIKTGARDPKDRVPGVGEPQSVPAIKDGDVVSPASKFTVLLPEYGGTLLASPESLAVRLVRKSARATGVKPLIKDHELVSKVAAFTESGSFWNHASEQRVQTRFLSQERLRSLLDRKELEFSPPRVAELLTAVHGVDHPDKLHQLSTKDFGIEKLQDFLSNASELERLKAKSGSFSSAGTRAFQGGIPLALGVAALFGAEAFADKLGLDPVRDRETRFALAVYAGHTVHSNVDPIWEVLSNKILRSPFDSMRTRQVRVAGETFTQWTFRHHPSLFRSMSSGWRSGALRINRLTTLALPSDVAQFEALRGTLGQKALRLAGVPIRAAWNMGQGLIFSRLIAALLEDLPENSAWRHFGPTAAFFAPELSQIVSPGFADSLFNARTMNFAGRVFAAGFIADLAFTGVQHLLLGEKAARAQYQDFQAAELRKQAGEMGTFHIFNLLGFVAPSLGAHLASHEYGFGEENEFRKRVQRETTAYSGRMEKQLRDNLLATAAILGKEPGELLRKKVVLSPLEDSMRGQLEWALENKRLSAKASSTEVSGYLQEAFRGHDFSSRQVLCSLARMELLHLQEALAQLGRRGFPFPINLPLIFDAQGLLFPGQEKNLAAWLQPTH